MLELLEKAQVFSLNLGEIAERTGLALNEKNLPQWKVEMAVEAARKFLTDIFAAMDHVASFTDREVEILSWKNLLNLEQMRGALPVSIGLSLQSGRDIKSLRREINSIRGRWVDEEALRRKAVGRRARSAGRRLLDNFLSGFREIAAGVTDKGYKSLRREEIRGKVEELIFSPLSLCAVMS